MKKILSVILALIVILTALPLVAVTVNAAMSGNCGENITYSIENNVLTLSGSGDMYHYDFWYNTVPWDLEKGDITKVIVEEGITSLGTNAFCDFIKLIDVELPTSLKNMGMNAFAGCESLTEFTIPCGLESFDVSAFANNYSMLEYKVAEGNTNFSVKDGVLFNADKTSLWSYPIGCINEVYAIPDTVETVEAYAFSEASNLKTILFNDNIKHIGDEAFHNCIGITEITLPNGFLTTGGGSFQGCENLSSIDLPDTVTRIGPLSFDMTAYYNNLDNWENQLVLYLDEFVLQGRERWDEVAGESDLALEGDYSIKAGTKLIADEAFDFLDITSIILPSSLKYIGEGAFYGCDNLTEVVIPENVTHIGEIAFTSCEKLASVSLPENLQRIGYDAFESTAFLDAIVNATNQIGYYNKYVLGVYSSLTTANIKEGITLIAENAFEKATSVSSISLPESLLYIGNEAFVNTSKTKNIEIPKSVISIGDYAFGFIKRYDYEAERYVYTHIDDFALSGYSDSSAEVYAEKFNVPFNSLNGCSHIYVSSVSKKPICTISGVCTYTCEKCGDTYTETIPEKGHSFGDWIEKTPATCTINGERYRICENCNSQEIETIFAIGHAYSSDFTIDKEPTLFEYGSASRHCGNCNSVTDVNTLPKISIADGKCGEEVLWAISMNGTLVIEGKGAIDDYKLKALTPWYEFSEDITSIEVAKEIIKIGNNCFNSLIKVTDVIISNPDTSFGYYVFKKECNFVVHSLGNSAVEIYAKNNNFNFEKFANPQNPKTPVLAKRSGNAVELQKVEGYEYSIDGINWQDSNIFENLVSGKTYEFYQRIKEGIYAASETSFALTVTLPSPPEAPVIVSVNDRTVVLKINDGYEYSIDGNNWQKNNTFNNVPTDKILNFYQRIAENGKDFASPTSDAVKCIIVSTPKVLVGATSLKITPVSGYEYCLDDMIWQESNVFTELVPEETYTVYQRFKNTNEITVSYLNSETTVKINGNDIISSPSATHLAWLKKLLLKSDKSNNLAADFNNDGEIDIRDFVSLKKILAK